MRAIAGALLVLAAYAAAAYADTPDLDNVQQVLEQNKTTCSAAQDYVQLTQLRQLTPTRADYVVRAADISYAGVINTDGNGDLIGAQLRGKSVGEFFCIRLQGATQ